MKWKLKYNNIVLGGEDFYISYLPFSSTNEFSETALCINNKFYILIGDHREEYEKRINNLKECVNYYQSSENKSFWTNEDIEKEYKNILILDIAEVK